MISSRISVFVCLALAAVSLRGQVYWSSEQPDCGDLWSLEIQNPVDPQGSDVYVCAVGGTFLWLAAGGPWGSTIRVSAPASNPVGVEYWFYDNDGNDLELDTTSGTGNAVTPTNDLTFALNPNQPSQINLLGTSGTNHSNTQTGSVYAEFYCPDQTTCQNILPQLLYSALPTIPWSLSVPLAWDVSDYYSLGSATLWSAVGIDDGASHRVSLAVYNQAEIDSSDPQISTSFTVSVYDQNGNLTGMGTTPPLAPIPTTTGSDGNTYAVADGGTWADLLSDVISTRLPSGPFKVVVDGGDTPCSVEVLQINGASATTLQVGFDALPDDSAATTTRAKALQKTRAHTIRKPRRPLGAFASLPR